MKKTPLEVGTKAPDFELKVTPDQTLSLSDFKGKNVVLVFYPADFSPVCQQEVNLFNEMVSEFDKHDAQILGISVDNVWSHLAFIQTSDLEFPLLSDFHPKGEISKRYNAYREEDGESERAVYLIDKNGKIAWGDISPVGISPGVDGVIGALEKMSKKT